MSRSDKPLAKSPRLGALLRIASQEMATRLAEWLARSEYSDLQPSHSAAIQPLWENREGARITTMAKTSRVTKQSMSALVDHLVERGYAERVRDAEDARAVRVRLTARGREFANAARATSRRVEAEWAALIGADRIETLIRTLDVLKTELSEMDGQERS